MAEPTFNPGDVVYMRESAALGFLEAVRVSSVGAISDGDWTYTVAFDGKLPDVPTFGDRVNYRQPHSVEYRESELVSLCDAADLVEAFHDSELTRIRSISSDRCD